MPLGVFRTGFYGAVSFTVEAEAEVIRKKVGVRAHNQAQISTAQSKFGGASAVFDGTLDYLRCYREAEWNDLANQSANHTIEFWARFDDVTTRRQIIGYRNASPNSLNGWAIEISTGSQLRVYRQGYSSYTTSTLSTNTWYHIAVEFNGSNVKLYLDGTNEVDATLSSYTDVTVDPETLFIGFNGYSGLTAFDGYIDEVRISDTIRYGASFTPSTTPFTNDDNTLLLLHCDGTDGSTYFEDDNGTRAKIGVRANGNAEIDTAQYKFGGASAYFDGTGDALLFDKSVGDFSSKTFTLECWIYPTVDTSSYRQIINNSWPAAVADRGWALTINPSDKIAFLYGYGTSQYYNFYGTTTITTNTWYHIAIVGDGTDLTMYIDGVEEATHTPSSINAGNENCVIGSGYTGSGGEITGYIDEVRFSDTARYTTSFTPDTAPFTNDTNTLLLLHMNGTDASTDFRDDNGKGRAQVGVSANGNAQVDTAQSKFGGASLLLDGNDWLTTSNIYTSSSEFTIEGWIRFTNLSTYATARLYQGNTGVANARHLVYITTPAHPTVPNRVYVALGTGGSYSFLFFDYSGTGFSTNTWYHIAVSRDSSNDIRVLVNGTQVGSAQNNTKAMFSTGTTTKIGYSDDNSHGIVGNVDEVRVSDTARYTSGFTPETTPFQNDANTLLLLHMDDTDGSTTFIDDNGTYTP